jgi:hypothetical protein
MCHIRHISGRSHNHLDAVNIIVGHANLLVNQPCLPELRANGGHTVKLDTTSYLATPAGSQIILRLSIDNAFFQILLASNGPTIGEIRASR